MRIRASLTTVLACALLGWSSPALGTSADPGDDALRSADPPRTLPGPQSGATRQLQAAESFDRGVQKFNQESFDDAARAFLEAYDLQPSDSALRNAVIAARKSNSPALLVGASEKVLAHPGSPTLLLRWAQEARAQNLANVARLDVACAYEPCSIWLDGRPLQPRTAYVMPGAHEVRASFAGALSASQLVACLAGEPCRVILRPAIPAPAPGSASESRPANGEVGNARAVPKWLLMTAIGATVVSSALTVGSGVDAMLAKRKHSTDPSSYDPDAVRSKARRTDWLLLGSLVLGGATLALAELGGRDGEPAPAPARVSVGEGTLWIEGSF